MEKSEKHEKPLARAVFLDISYMDERDMVPRASKSYMEKVHHFHGDFFGISIFMFQ